MPHNPMKLALMSSQCSWGGGEQFLWSLGRGLQARGHTVLWVCDDSSPLHARVADAGYDSFSLRGRTPRPSSVYKLRRECKRRKIELLHVNDSHALTWGSLAMFGRLNIKRVGVKHTIFPIRSSIRYNWFLDKIVCVSQAVQRATIDGGVLAKKTAVIHGGVELPPMDRNIERFEARTTLGIGADVPIYCAVGSLIACKGYDQLVEAAQRLRWHLPDFRIVVCGEGPERAHLERLIRKHDVGQYVHLHGFQNQPERWIAAADAFVHPTQSEGLSLVTIQAQMIGAPVIATEVGGLREVMRKPDDDTPLGFILPERDPDRLADLMYQAIQETPARRAMVFNAKLSATQRFQVSTMVDGFERLYAGLVSPSYSLTSMKPDASAA